MHLFDLFSYYKRGTAQERIAIHLDLGTSFHPFSVGGLAWLEMLQWQNSHIL